MYIYIIRIYVYIYYIFIYIRIYIYIHRNRRHVAHQSQVLKSVILAKNSINAMALAVE